jgi:hypothetical protein
VVQLPNPTTQEHTKSPKRPVLSTTVLIMVSACNVFVAVDAFSAREVFFADADTCISAVYGFDNVHHGQVVFVNLTTFDDALIPLLKV